MTNLTQSRNAAQKNAQNYFKKAELQPETLVKQGAQKRARQSLRTTAKLRELRLAKEAVERKDRDNSADENGAAPRPKRASAVRSVVRMTY
jgi:hypothetical protein